MEKGGRGRVIDRNEIRGDDPIKYFLPMGIRSMIARKKRQNKPKN